MGLKMENKTVYTLIFIALVLGAGIGIAATESFDDINMQGYQLLNTTNVTIFDGTSAYGCIEHNGSHILIDGVC